MSRYDPQWPWPGLGLSLDNVRDAATAVLDAADGPKLPNGLRRLTARQQAELDRLGELLWQAVLAEAAANRPIPAQTLRWAVTGQ